MKKRCKRRRSEMYLATLKTLEIRLQFFARTLRFANVYKSLLGTAEHESGDSQPVLSIKLEACLLFGNISR